jgi:hypothetical protein
MAGSSDDIQPLREKHRELSAGGNFPAADVLMAGTAETSRPRQRPFPIQSQWPPAYLGFVLDILGKPLEIEGVENVRHCTDHNMNSSDELANRPSSNPLLAIWSATRQRIGNYDYLVLPPVGPGGAESNWLESHNPGYPSNKILIRKSYEKAFSIFLKENANLYRRGSHLALGGTPGLGKTFFIATLFGGCCIQMVMKYTQSLIPLFCGPILKSGKDIFITRGHFI